MELKIFWTDFSRQELQKIFDYLKENAGLRIAKNEIQKIVKETLQIKNQPEIGQQEELLVSRKKEFRYLVHQNYKIIYWVNRDFGQVEVIDIFDTRQNPTKIQRSE